MNNMAVKLFMISATIVMTVIALGIISVAVILPLAFPHIKVPVVIENWGGLIIGFYFGTFATTLKDLTSKQS